MAPTLTQALKKRGMTIPSAIRPIVDSIGADPALTTGIDTLMTRARQFTDERTAMLAGIALHEPSRRHFDDMLDNMWSDEPPSRHNEVVVGAGLHAAIYCAIRVASGYKRPLVLEANERAGGAMAMTREAGFWLNSRNRPGPLGVPGQLASLNVLPGAPVQPSDIGGGDYQSNRDLAWIIRATLAMNATVATGQRVEAVEPKNAGDYRYRLLRESGSVICLANRVIIAPGLGDPNALTTAFESRRLITFAQFMERMDGPFPLQGLNRVAVVGAGDSGKTAVEALTGKGPSTRWSVASLDWPQTIDWYGCAFTNCKGWEQDNRSRYRGIGVLLGQEGAPRRVNPKPRAGALSGGYDAVYVNGMPYDLVINCTGFTGNLPITPWSYESNEVGGRVCALTASGEDVHVVGPATRLPFSDDEKSYMPTVVSNRDNSTALFRWADRTATFSADLPATVPPVKGAFVKALVREAAAAGYAPVVPQRRRPTVGMLGYDKAGQAIYVGDTVTSIAGRNVVLGQARENASYIVLGTLGDYSLNDDIQNIYGIDPKEVKIESRAYGDVLGYDENGWPIRAGMYVTYTELRGQYYQVLGPAADSFDRLVLALATADGGSFKFDGESVYGVFPDACTLTAAPALYTGLTVRIFGSSRYSNDTPLLGTITRVGADRPTIKLADGRDDDYQPSYGRIAILPERTA